MKDSIRFEAPIEAPRRCGSRAFETPGPTVRRRTCAASSVITDWPEFDASALPARLRRKFKMRHRAVELYVAHFPIRRIEQQTGVDRREIYRLVDRCAKVHEDGRAFGYRALVPYARVAGYQRVAQVRSGNTGGSRGTAGAFVMLLQEHPGLGAWIRKQIADKRVAVDQISTGGGVRTRLRGLKQLHLSFLRECRAQGITAAEYPLNTERMGIRALAQAIRAEYRRGLGGRSHLTRPTQLKE
jgi:putative transposase